MRGLRRPIVTTLLLLLIAFSAPWSAMQQERVPPERALPERVLINAYDPAHLNGIVFITGHQLPVAQSYFGLRVLVYRPGAVVEDAPRNFDFGPHAPDGSYASVSWRSQLDDQTPVTLRWSRINQNTVIGRISAPANVRVALEIYRPWSETAGDESWATFFAQPDRRTILGEQVQNQKNTGALRRFFLRTDRTAIGAASYEDAAAMRKMLVKEGHAQQGESPEKPGIYHFAALSYDLTQDSSFGFTAMVGENFDVMEREAEKVLQKPLVEALDQAEKKDDAARTLSAGALGKSLEAVSRAVNWNRFYNPEKQTEYVAMQRLAGRALSPESGKLSRGAALSWDTMIEATMGALVDVGSSTATIRAILEGQALDGRLPLRRSLQNQSRGEPSALTGRSMPPIGALCVWKVYLSTYDLGLLAWAYPRLLQWNEWWMTNRGDGQAWRDGNGDGLLEWGYDAEMEHGALGARMISNQARLKQALAESGLDDRPQWGDGEEIKTKPPESSNGPNAAGRQSDEVRYNDRTHTLEFSPVALNALYVLDTEILMRMAGELGLTIETDKLKTRLERMRNTFNAKLWSEEDGMYLNRHWDGRFSRRLSLENFYPLVAGLADEERAKRMLTTLRDPKKFWGDYPLATIARDDPAFAARTPGRGAAWALSNYLIYVGLRRYGFHDEAAELARKSTALARAATEKTGRLFDHYSSLDGRALETDDDPMRTSFAGLMFWPGIEELLSADPWAGMSVGSVTAAEESRVERVTFSGVSFDVIFGPKRTVVRRNGNIEVECEGPARLRAYRGNDRALGFAVETREQIRVLVPAVEGRKITISVDDKVLGSTSVGAAASFKVPAGTHKVFIIK